MPLSLPETPRPFPDVGTRITLVLQSNQGLPVELRGTVLGEPRCYGYDLPSGPWSFEATQEGGEPSWVVPMRRSPAEWPTWVRWCTVLRWWEGWEPEVSGGDADAHES